MFTEAGMREAFAETKALYELAGAPAAPELFFDDCGHDYSRPMRERAYGFFLKALAGKGSGGPIPEDASWKAEKPETLFFYPEGRVPLDSMTYRQSVLDRIALCRGKRGAEVVEKLREIVLPVASPDWKEEAVDAAGVSLVTDEKGFRHRVWVRRGPPGKLAVLALEDSGLTSRTPELLDALAKTGAAEVAVVEPPFWNVTGDAGTLAATNGLLLGEAPSVLWARTLVGHCRRQEAQGRRVVLFARGAVSSLTALVASLADEEASLVAISAPAAWIDLVDPGVNRPGALLPGGGLSGEVSDLLRATAPRETLWAGSGLRTELPLSVELRDESPSLADAADWIRSRVGH